MMSFVEYGFIVAGTTCVVAKFVMTSERSIILAGVPFCLKTNRLSSTSESPYTDARGALMERVRECCFWTKGNYETVATNNKALYRESEKTSESIDLGHSACRNIVSKCRKGIIMTAF
jgi:hypothetical protein